MATRKNGRAKKAPPGPLIDFAGVRELSPLSRDRTRALTHSDPRFPRPLFGGAGRGCKGYWPRDKVAAYFRQLVREGSS